MREMQLTANSPVRMSEHDQTVDETPQTQSIYQI